jgi:hypothetical protein
MWAGIFQAAEIQILQALQRGESKSWKWYLSWRNCHLTVTDPEEIIHGRLPLSSYFPETIEIEVRTLEGY